MNVQGWGPNDLKKKSLTPRALWHDASDKLNSTAAYMKAMQC